jgi:hypothetical protein
LYSLIYRLCLVNYLEKYKIIECDGCIIYNDKKPNVFYDYYHKIICIDCFNSDLYVNKKTFELYNEKTSKLIIYP